MCGNPNTCDICEWGYKLDSNGLCEEICPNGYIDPRVAGENCLECPENFNCDSCGFDNTNQTPICLTCPEGFIIVPDGRCALSCSDAGYNLVIDIFGNEKCVIDCPVGFGPDFFTNNLC